MFETCSFCHSTSLLCKCKLKVQVNKKTHTFFHQYGVYNHSAILAYKLKKFKCLLCSSFYEHRQIWLNVTTRVMEQNHTEAIVKMAGQVAFTRISFSLNLFWSAFHQETHHVTFSWAINVLGQSHECQPSQATIKLASKVNVLRNWGNLPLLPFNKKKLLHNSVRGNRQ